MLGQHLRARPVLVGRDELHVHPGNRVGAVALEPRGERFLAVAVLRAGGEPFVRIKGTSRRDRQHTHVRDDVAVVFDAPPRADAALEEHALARPRVQHEVGALPLVCLCPELARERYERVHRPAEHLRLDVVQVVDDVATSTGQVRMGRRRDAVPIEVCWRGREISRHGEVPEPAAEVGDVQRDIRRQLVLHATRELPVEWPLPVPGHRILVEVQIRHARAEVPVRQPAALPVSPRNRGIQYAIRDEVAVAVIPGPSGRQDQIAARVGEPGVAHIRPHGEPRSDSDSP